MKVIAICGLPGSGKSTAIEAIKDLGIVVSMGDIVRNEAKKRKLEPSDAIIGKIAKEMRETGGAAIIAEKCIELIKDMSSEVVFVDGVRSLFEVNVFRKLWKFPIVAIKVDEEKRIKRLFKRGRSDDPKHFQELKIRDKREREFGQDDVLKNADYIILNNSTINELKKKSRKLIIDIINNY
ncbi:MAG: AAA family ATPase [Candidatus Odinarchaeota archaeon]